MKSLVLSAGLLAASFSIAHAQTASAPPATPTAAPAPTSSAAPTPAPAPAAPYGGPVTLQQARAAVVAAEAEARRMGWMLSFAVVEPSGQLVHFARMDGANYGSIALAEGKARTAAHFARSTKVFSDGIAAGRLGALGIEGVVPIEGGVPLVVGGRTIGAIGVSGASAAQDGQVAQAAAAAVR